MKKDYSFQEQAVSNIEKDFKEDPFAKLLLVIPTGGGKTLTAIKAINNLIEKGKLAKDDKVLWATHRKELKRQTEKYLKDKNTISKYKYKQNKHLKNVLNICMNLEAVRRLRNDIDNVYKIIIIDEAHHSAANSYKEFFSPNRAILGLTATPTRTDDCKLEFDKITYSITFKELIRRNVIIKPEFNRILTNTTIYATSLDNNDQELNKFDINPRNQFIAQEIIKRKTKFKKVIIFTGTNEHARRLYDEIKKENDFMGCPYEHVGYIFGSDNNEKNISNTDYLDWHKGIKSSILVNCKLLNEGYDDPSIDTVVMAVPTKSILYYMQCVGRVVRSSDDIDKVYVVEMIDNLPNINYRIDNKWLFADISDNLEPEVIEKEYYDTDSYKDTLEKIFSTHGIRHKISINSIIDLENTNVLLLQAYKDWKYLFITAKNRTKYINIFNIISNNINSYYVINHEHLFFKQLKVDKNDEYFGDHKFRTDFLSTLKKAYDEILGHIKVTRIKYICFTKVAKYPEGFLEFIANCYNKEYIQNEYENLLVHDAAIMKFPLILGSLEGFYAKTDCINFCDKFMKTIKEIKGNKNPEDHESLIHAYILSLKDIPIPIKYLYSMISMVRENELDNKYYLILERRE